MEMFVKKYEELTLDELYEILKLRAAVFVVEQGCSYVDMDERDKKAYHVFLKDEDGMQAYLRVMDRGVADSEVCIGRVLSLKRRLGLGSMVLIEGIKTAKEKYGAKKVVLNAQTYVKSMYEKQGFVAVSDEFLEENMPHIRMELDLQDKIKL